MSISGLDLGEHLDHFVEGQVATGRYRNTDEVVRAALRLLEDRQVHLDALRAALIEGETSGPPVSFDFDAFVARKREQAPAG